MTVVEATTNEIFLRSVEVQLAIFYIRINSGGDESSNHTDCLFLANVDDSHKISNPHSKAFKKNR